MMAGMPLRSRDGEQIGIIGAVTVHPIRDLDAVRSALRVFGTRLSLELERAIAGESATDDIAEAVRAEEQRLLEAARQAS